MLHSFFTHYYQMYDKVDCSLDAGSLSLVDECRGICSCVGQQLRCCSLSSSMQKLYRRAQPADLAGDVKQSQLLKL